MTANGHLVVLAAGGTGDSGGWSACAAATAGSTSKAAIAGR